MFLHFQQTVGEIPEMLQCHCNRRDRRCNRYLVQHPCFWWWNSYKSVDASLEKVLISKGLLTLSSIWVILQTMQHLKQSPCGLEDRIQPTTTLMHVISSNYLRDMNCPIPAAHCMLGLPACNGVYELGQLGTGLSWEGNILFQWRMSSFF